MSDIKAIEKRMEGAIESLKKEFMGLRTGRASVNLLEPVVVDAYGSKMPISQVGTVGVPEARMLTVQVWDAGLVKSVEKAITDAGLGLNPQPEGNMIRIPVPALNEERRAELTKVAAKYAEQARIAVRNVRRDGMDDIKKGDLSEDEQRVESGKVQEATDRIIKQIDDLLKHKEEEIMQV